MPKKYSCVCFFPSICFQKKIDVVQFIEIPIIQHRLIWIFSYWYVNECVFFFSLTLSRRSIVCQILDSHKKLLFGYLHIVVLFIFSFFRSFIWWRYENANMKNMTKFFIFISGFHFMCHECQTKISVLLFIEGLFWKRKIFFILIWIWKIEKCLIVFKMLDEKKYITSHLTEQLVCQPKGLLQHQQKSQHHTQ